MEKILVKTTPSYNVIIEKNGLENLPEYLEKISHPCKVCIISDSNVAPLFGKKVDSLISNSGYEVFSMVFSAGEKSKSMKNTEKILEFLSEKNFTRTDMLIALGGGVVGDLTGFAAAVYLRGIKYIQLPTTLLASVDSSVGGKTAVNLPAGKNLAGAFWQPSLVLFDINTIESLPEPMFKDGLAEMIKSSIISNEHLFNEFLQSDDFSIEKWVSETVKIKAAIVSEDEKDNGNRQLLNFGHTIAHSIELCSNYKISHGHAVAIGMYLCSKASHFLDWSQENTYEKIFEILNKYGYDLHCPFTAEELIEAAYRDKKRRGELITLVIPEKIGKCYLRELPVTQLLNFLKLGVD